MIRAYPYAAAIPKDVVAQFNTSYNLQYVLQREKTVVTALHNAYNAVRGKDYRHNVAESRQFEYKSMRNKLVLEWPVFDKLI